MCVWGGDRGEAYCVHAVVWGSSMLACAWLDPVLAVCCVWLDPVLAVWLGPVLAVCCVWLDPVLVLAYVWLGPVLA